MQSHHIIKFFGLLGSLLAYPLHVPAQAAPVAQNAQDLFQPDSRVQQKVALQVTGVPIGEVLQRIEKKTGISLTVQSDIADEKLIVFTGPRPLSESLSDIAVLFNDQWLQVDDPANPNGPPRYKLVRDARAREYEERLANGPMLRMIDRLDAQAQALTDTPDQLKQRDPVTRASLADPDRRLATQMYAQLNGEQKEKLFTTGCSDNLAFDTLPSDVQQGLYAWLQARYAEDKAQREKNPPPTSEELGLPPGFVPDPHFNPTADELKGGVLRMVLFGAQRPEVADVRLQINDAIFLVMRRVNDEGGPVLAEHANPYTQKPVAATASIPDAKALAETRAETHFCDKLRSLFHATGEPIFSDLFRCAPDTSAVNVPISNPRSPNLLRVDAFCQAHNRLWWLRGDTLLLRTRDWFTQRQYEVPDQWVREVSRQLEVEGKVACYRDLFRILELTPKQIIGLERAYNPSPYNHIQVLNGVQEMVRLLESVVQNPDKKLPLRNHDSLLLARIGDPLAEKIPTEPPDTIDLAAEPGRMAALLARVFPARPQSMSGYVARAQMDFLWKPHQIPVIPKSAYTLWEHLNAPGITEAERKQVWKEIRRELQPQTGEQRPTSDELIRNCISPFILLFGYHTLPSGETEIDLFSAVSFSVTLPLKFIDDTSREVVIEVHG